MIEKIFNLNFKLRRLLYPIWNRIKFRIKHVAFGYNMMISTNMYLTVSLKAKIQIGNNFVFTSGECFNPLCRNIKGCIITESEAIISIGNDVGMSSTCLWAHKKITIGNNVKIGGDTIIMDSDAHSLDFVLRRNPLLDQNNKKNIPITIEDDVLIGARCIILKGVTIGARSVIGSGSVVTKSIPADCIAAGNPCKVIRCFHKK